MNKAILRFPDFKAKAFTLTYDDGLKYDDKLVALMKKYGFKGTFNINSELCAQEPQVYSASARMTIEECVALFRDSGNEVAVHGAHHVPLIAVERSFATQEIISDRRNLEQAFKQVIKGMAYPYSGAYDEETKEVIKNCGIAYARTAEYTHSFELPADWLLLNPTCHQADKVLFELAQEFADFQFEKVQWKWYRNTLKWFTVLGHSAEHARDNSWNRIEKLGEILGNRGDIWYATTGEVYDYVQAFERLEFSVDNRLVRNKSVLDVYLTLNDKNYVIPAGKTVEIGELSLGKELL
jgi:peptidoglycan/xylan/chitin deacetylase (PgdA/CDA1 family)